MTEDETKPKCPACGRTDGPYAPAFNRTAGDGYSGCPRCGWCY